jgi:DNA anti-recombination protein RmuC
MASENPSELAAERRAGGDASGAPDESLEQVRDLLFGKQVRESEKRFARLEQRLAESLAELRADTAKRLETLEGFVKSELQSLTRRLQEEREARGAELQRLGRDLADSVADLARRLDDQREESARSASELQQELLARSKSLGDDFVRRLGEQSSAAERRLEELRASAVDRGALSALLAQLALQLGEDGNPSE